MGCSPPHGTDGTDTGRMPSLEDPLKFTETEHDKTFRTHAAYLRAFRMLAVGPVRRSTDAAHAEIAQRLNAQLPQRPARPVAADAALDCLRRAWGTELILNTTIEVAGDSEIINLANAWGSVQAYYVLYGATQSLMVAEGYPRPEAHEPTQKTFITQWLDRRLSLLPWSLAASHTGDKRADPTTGFCGSLRPPLDQKRVHPWSNWTKDEALDVAAQALIGTRNDEVEDKVKDRRKQKHKVRRADWQREEDERIVQKQKPRVQPQ